jgi:hypothetical protein
VSYVEQVVRAGQLHLRTVSRASAIKLNRVGAGQNQLSISLACISVFKTMTVVFEIDSYFLFA